MEAKSIAIVPYEMWMHRKLNIFCSTKPIRGFLSLPYKKRLIVVIHYTRKVLIEKVYLITKCFIR